MLLSLLCVGHYVDKYITMQGTTMTHGELSERTMPKLYQVFQLVQEYRLLLTAAQYLAFDGFGED